MKDRVEGLVYDVLRQHNSISKYKKTPSYMEVFEDILVCIKGAFPECYDEAEHSAMSSFLVRRRNGVAIGSVFSRWLANEYGGEDENN